jgi:hypothetical protein
MTPRARWLTFVACLGLVAGAARGQVGLVFLSLTILVWLAFEWLRFQMRLWFELPYLRFERSVNQRTEKAGTLWAGRRIEVRLRAISDPQGVVATKPPKSQWQTRNLFPRNLWSGMGARGKITLRDVVPEIFELVGSAPPQDVMRDEVRAHRLRNLLLSPLRALSRLFALQTHSNVPIDEPVNQWTLHRTESESEFGYSLTARGVGRAKLPGVRITLSDSFGFFQAHRFVKVEQEFRILSDYFQKGDIHPTVKRFNALPAHGIHRLQRSGVSSELLELREYVAGDPPKSIAWKASARREMLMTRQYESEVPVRIQFLIDGSISNRVGGFGLRLLDQTNYVAASVAKAALGVGDPVSATLIDESGAERLPWFVGDLGFLQMLKAFAEFTEREPPIALQLSPSMLGYAYGVCHERYPDLMERKYHSVPLSFFSSTSEKYRLIGVLGQLFSLSAREQAECYGDDARLAYFVQRLLHEAGMPWMAPLFSGNFDFDASSARTVDMLSRAMGQAIARAKDNEVFVILADPQTCANRLEKLLPVVRLALAKHHRVAFVCPSTTFLRPTTKAVVPRSNSVRELLLVAEQARARELNGLLKRELVRLGVSVTYSADRDAIRMVLAEMDMARAGRSRMQGVRP